MLLIHVCVHVCKHSSNYCLQLRSRIDKLRQTRYFEKKPTLLSPSIIRPLRNSLINWTYEATVYCIGINFKLSKEMFRVSILC